MSPSNPLTYEDLKLGEKAKEAFLRGETPEQIEGNYPIYLNTREVYSGLNVTDLAIAGVLGGLNSLLVGNTGTGKSQLAEDFFNYYFGGNKVDDGKSVKIRGMPELDIYSEVYRDLDIEKGKWIPNENVNAMYHFLDELNRCPEISQNQFFGLGDGFLEHRGMKLPLGEKGYSVLTATANLGNGEFGGTFETDKALYNRFPLVLDFDYKQFEPTREDRILIDILRSANPKIKDSPLRDISGLILHAEREISDSSRDLGLEAECVINYIKFGLENCYNPKIGSKEKVWPTDCQDCDLNKDENTLCSLIRSPVPRTIGSLRKYSVALDYLIKLKNPKIKFDSVDLVFKAFELVGAYQSLLNPGVLRRDYSEQNPKMMGEVVRELKEDYRKNEDFIITSIEQARRGEKFDDYFKTENGKICVGYSTLSKKAIASDTNIQRIEPFKDTRPIGMSWVKDMIKLDGTVRELRNKTKK